MGISASAISRDGLVKKYAKSRSGVRMIKRRAPVSSMFIYRHTGRSTRVNLSPEDVDDIVSRDENEHREYQSGDTKINFKPTQFNEVLDKDDAGHFQVYSIRSGERKRTTPRKKATEGRKLKPKELLMPLQTALSGEIMEFALPYIQIHLMAWDILSAIKDACDPILLPVYGITYLQNEWEISEVVTEIFAELCADPEGIGKQLMRTAAQAFDKTVKEKGGVDVVRKIFSEREGMSLCSSEELFGESHERYHERHGGEPVEDCNWGCGWHADWENDDEKEKEDDKEEENDKQS